MKIFIKLFLIILFVPALSFAQDKPDALQMYRNGNFKAAEEVCRVEIKEMPKNMDSYTVLGWSLIKQKKYTEALESGTQALKISRYDSRVIEICGEANYYLGNNIEALNFFQEYAKLVPDGGRIDVVYYYMGEIFLRLGEYHHSDIAFSTALYYSPNIARWWARLGYAREMKDDYKWALDSYDKSLKLNPSYTEALRGKNRVQKKISG
jgi:tetratricopeptide (TPR) repeat protein